MRIQLDKIGPAEVGTIVTVPFRTGGSLTARVVAVRDTPKRVGKYQFWAYHRGDCVSWNVQEDMGARCLGECLGFSSRKEEKKVGRLSIMHEEGGAVKTERVVEFENGDKLSYYLED